MNRKFGVACHLEFPKIAYKETISGSVQAVEGKHKKQSGGSGQFGVCFFDLSHFTIGGREDSAIPAAAAAALFKFMSAAAFRIHSAAAAAAALLSGI